MVFKQLQDMALFALVVECGSFTAAAQRAALPKSSVSQRISQLEQSLGLRLLNRTTRQLSLTCAGECYVVHCREMLQASEKAELAIQRLRDNPSGRLRITAPAGIAATLLAQLTTDFQRQYPEVSLEILVSDSVKDLVSEGFDVALRTGKPKDSSLIGRKLGHSVRHMVASAEYIAQHVALTHPKQLAAHPCIAHRAWGEWTLWQGDDVYRYQLPRMHITDNLLYARECVRAGAGITLLPYFLCADAIAEGTLVPVLTDWNVEGNDIYLVYPSRKLNSSALDCFIRLVVQHPLFVGLD